MSILSVSLQPGDVVYSDHGIIDLYDNFEEDNEMISIMLNTGVAFLVLSIELRLDKACWDWPHVIVKVLYDTQIKYAIVGDRYGFAKL